MKLILGSLGFLAIVAPLLAQDNRLPQEAARRYAQVCLEQAGHPADAQIALEADPGRACAERGEGGGAMVIPDKRLTRAKLKKLGKEIVPVGQLWLRKWTLVKENKPVANDQLRMVTINVDDGNRPMALLLLGIRQPPGKGPELVVFAGKAEPLQVIALKKIDFVQKLPLEIEWRRGEKQADPLALNILGRYQAVLQITGQGP